MPSPMAPEFAQLAAVERSYAYVSVVRPEGLVRPQSASTTAREPSPPVQPTRSAASTPGVVSSSPSSMALVELTKTTTCS